MSDDELIQKMWREWTGEVLGDDERLPEPCPEDIDAMRAVLAVVREHDGRDAWQSIETAPRDGTRVLLRSPQGKIADGMYHVRYGVWSWPYVMVEPTHWAPLRIDAAIARGKE